MITQTTFDIIRSLDKLDEFQGHDIFRLLSSTGEEYGELCKAVNKENENLFSDEPSYMEAVDLVICALTLYQRLAGNFDLLNENMREKLAKWEKKHVLL